MKRESLKQHIDNTIISKCKLPHNFFESKPDKGESILIRKDLIKDKIRELENMGISKKEIMKRIEK